MNSNKTQRILFATPNFNKRTETFQITIDDTVRHMEDKVKNLGVCCKSGKQWEVCKTRPRHPTITRLEMD